MPAGPPREKVKLYTHTLGGALRGAEQGSRRCHIDVPVDRTERACAGDADRLVPEHRKQLLVARQSPGVGVEDQHRLALVATRAVCRCGGISVDRCCRRRSRRYHFLILVLQ